MAVYAIWNNKGGVGKSYLTFQLACEYAIQHPDRKVLVIDLCPQANSSSMLLGGMEEGEKHLNAIHFISPRKTISGYINERIRSPYQPTKSGMNYITQVCNHNNKVPENVFLVVGDEQLELQSSRVSGATKPGPEDAWRIVHLWITDLIEDIKYVWNGDEICVFIDCNPSFSIYTELALIAAERLLIPFSADGASKRAVRAVLSLVYGNKRLSHDTQSEFYIESLRYKINLPSIYMYIGNRLTQMNHSSASAFKTIVTEISEEIYSAWQTSNVPFFVNPLNARKPTTPSLFKKMFQFEVNDANTASVVSSALGIPISTLNAGFRTVAGKRIMVNQTQLDKQVPNIRALVSKIE